MILFAVRPKFESRSIAEEYSVRLSEEGSHYFNCSAKSNLTRQNPKQNSVTSTNRTRHIMQSADHLGRTNEPQTQTSLPFNWRRDAACKKGDLVCACERVKRQLFCKFVRIGQKNITKSLTLCFWDFVRCGPVAASVVPAACGLISFVQCQTF